MNDPGAARELAMLEEEDVLAVEDIKSLGGVVVDVHGRSETRRFGSLQQRKCHSRVIGRRLHDHREVAHVDEAAIARFDANPRWHASGTSYLPGHRRLQGWAVGAWSIQRDQIAHSWPVGHRRRSARCRSTRGPEDCRTRRLVHQVRLASRDQASAIHHLIDDTKHRSGICGSVLHNKGRVSSRVSVAVLEMEQCAIDRMASTSPSRSTGAPFQTSMNVATVAAGSTFMPISVAATRATRSS